MEKGYRFNRLLRANPRVRLYAGDDRFFGPGTRGGAGGGSAKLTPAGDYLLDQFAAYEQAIKRYAQQQLQQFFPIEEQEGEQT